MRLSPHIATQLKTLSVELAGEQSHLRLFGSRTDDNARGGDVDLLLECPQEINNPAMLAARLSARASRLMAGRRVDVVVLAPNLKRLPIHHAALQNGIEL